MAAKIPKGIPIIIAKNNPTIPNSTVAGKRSINSLQTVLLEIIEFPKSPCNVFFM